jgi:hypothetical protein
MPKLFMTCFLIILTASCSQNYLKELSDKNSDDAIIYDAKVAVNEQNYDHAIELLTQRLSAGSQTKAEAREVLAGAYAGKCGLNFLTFIDGLANAVSGSIFRLVSNPFIGVDVDANYCLDSLQTLDLIGAPDARTTNQNAFASIVGMVLMGASTRSYTDDSPVGGDGNQDSVGISCGLTNSQIDNIILGFGYMSQNITAISASQIGSISSNTILQAIAACTALAGSSCEITNPSAINNSLRDVFKDLLNTTQYGIGAADGSNPLLIPSSCP